MKTTVSSKVKKDTTIKRLKNIFRLVPMSLKFYGQVSKDDVTEKMFAEFLGVKPDYWQLIIHGVRNLSDKKSREIESHLGLSSGDLDNTTHADIPDYAWEIIFTITEIIREQDLTISQEKIREITKLSIDDYELKNFIDKEKIASLVLISS